MLNPPGIGSEPETVMPIMKSSPAISRIRRQISSAKRTRFSSDPPHLSVRRLVSGDQN